MNSYELSRSWFDFCFENPEKINPAHTAIYLFSVEHCNRLGWKKKFGFPSQMTMDAIGIKRYQTYIKYFNDIIDWGFFELIQKSKNQYSSNIISLIAYTKNNKALDKALIKHKSKQSESIVESTVQSIDSIVKPINKEPINIEDLIKLISFVNKNYNKLPIGDKQKVFKAEVKENSMYDVELLKAFFTYWSEPTNNKSKIRKDLEKTWSTSGRLVTWSNNKYNAK